MTTDTPTAAPRWHARRGPRTLGALGLFFGLKIALGLVLLGLSTRLLSIAGFVTFSQLFLFFALLSTVSAAGVQNGLARQIALAQGRPDDERRAIAAALRIWAILGLTAVAAAFVLRQRISHMLVDDGSLASAVPWVTMLAVAGGFGLLASAVFNGRRHAPTSLVLQSAGMAAGGLLCIWRLTAADPVGAVIGYAAGPVATSVLGTILLRRTGIRVRGSDGIGAEMRLLLGFALAFLAVATIMPATLFALRDFYRDAFGTALLGYWLAANRVSDVTSQVLGLYMAQLFLPQATHERDPARLRRLLALTLAGGTAVMLGGWAIFTLAAPILVTTFLSATYLPAIPFIAGYLLGDGLRVTSSLAIHLMLAHGRPAASVAIETGTAVLLGAYLLALVALGREQAPYWAYPAAYATMAGLLLIRWRVGIPGRRSVDR